MPDETPSVPIPPSPEPAAEQPPPSPNLPFNIGEEFGTAKKNLPPAKILAICVAAILIVIGVIAFTNKAHTSAAGSVDDVTAVEIPNQGSVLVAITVSFQNNGDKAFYIHTMKADLEASSGSYSDDAASVADFDRYYQAFPALKEHAQKPLTPEDKILPGGKETGTIIVSFPVTNDVFANRKSLKVTIWPYDQPVPLVLSK